MQESMMMYTEAVGLHHKTNLSGNGGVVHYEIRKAQRYEVSR